MAKGAVQDLESSLANFKPVPANVGDPFSKGHHDVMMLNSNFCLDL